MYEGTMVIFGGFVEGQRMNDIYRYYFKENKWEKVQNLGIDSPQPRAGHSSIIYGDSLFIFGGKDEENNKLSDVWEFNFNTSQWALQETQNTPVARSGHSACLYKDTMVVFGGIFEVTKELNDMMIYDIKNKNWITLFEEQSSPIKTKNTFISPDNSPESKGFT